jgi:hypothetical protein
MVQRVLKVGAEQREGTFYRFNNGSYIELGLPRTWINEVVRILARNRVQ